MADEDCGEIRCVAHSFSQMKKSFLYSVVLRTLSHTGSSVFLLNFYSFYETLLLKYIFPMYCMHGNKTTGKQNNSREQGYRCIADTHFVCHVLKPVPQPTLSYNFWQLPLMYWPDDD